jgi:hypothetical protein
VFALSPLTPRLAGMPGRRVLLLAAAVTLMLLTLGVNASRAEALCSGPPPENGSWVSADPNTRGFTRVELSYCQSVTTCSGSTCTIAHDAGWRMHVWGKCHPTDCDWGWSAGAFPVSGWVYGYYDHGFAKVWVYARMADASRPGQLRVWSYTDFVDPGRPDYASDEYFVRA